MWTRQKRRSRLRHAIVPLAAFALLSYFGFHATNGALGLNSSQAYDERIIELRQELAGLQHQSEVLEHRTAQLRDGSLERDLIEEQAKIMLGMTRPNELVLLHRSN